MKVGGGTSPRAYFKNGREMALNSPLRQRCVVGRGGLNRY